MWSTVRTKRNQRVTYSNNPSTEIESVHTDFSNNILLETMYVKMWSPDLITSCTTLASYQPTLWTYRCKRHCGYLLKKDKTTYTNKLTNITMTSLVPSSQLLSLAMWVVQPY